MPSSGYLGRSDSLRLWRGLERPSLIPGQVDPVDVFLLVFDSSALQRDLRWLARVSTKATNDGVPRTALLEAMDAGVVIGLVPPNALEEVASHLPEIADAVEVPLNVVEALWHDYRRRLLVFRPYGGGTNTALAKRDPSDLPFVATFQEAAADALLTADRDLLDHVEGAHTPRDVANTLREYARAKAVAIAGQAPLTVTGVALTMGPKFIAKAARTGMTALGRLPWWAQLIAVGVGTWAITRPEFRAWLKQVPDHIATFASKASIAMIHQLETAAAAETEAREARTRLATRLGRPRRPRRLSLRAAMLRILAPASFGLTVDQVACAALELGYRTTARDFPSTVLRRLRLDATFVERGGRWHLAVAR